MVVCRDGRRKEEAGTEEESMLILNLVFCVVIYKLQ